MAYVVWRVFMKKYAKIRRTVNPAERPAICMDTKGSEAAAAAHPDDTPVEAACEAFDDAAPAAATQEFAPNQPLRKSTKAQRVKSYLKKCKDAALGTNSAQPGDEAKAESAKTVPAQDQLVEPTTVTATATRTEHKGQKEVLPNTCWYVVDNFESTSSVEDQVPVYELAPPPPPGAESEVRETHVNYDLGGPPVTFETCKIRKGHNSSECLRGKVSGADAVPKSRPASVRELEEDNLSARRQLNCAASKDVTGGSSASAAAAAAAAAEAKCVDVGGLVDRHLGQLYANFGKSRGVLVRQARDLLVCTYHGNLTLFETDFLLPAAALLRRICDAVTKDTWDTVVPRGWPLSLGSKGITLQLGELDPTLLRNRDYYLCVRCATPTPTSPSATHTDGVEAALVWRYHSTLGSHTLLRSVDDDVDEEDDADDLETPLRLDMAAAAAVNAGQEARDANNMTGLLQSLLVSVERAIERVSLEDLAFPCPQCHAYLLATDYTDDDVVGSSDDGVCSCQCSCKHSDAVEKKDTSIQTSPLFEFTSIPHIDSDDDEEGYQDNYRKLSLDSGIHTSLALTLSPPQEELVPPKSISELDDKWLLSGIHLPGTHDVLGRPLVLYDTLNVSRAALNQHQIATTILYYSTLPSHEKMAKGLTILVVSGPAEEAALNLLDKAFSLLAKHVKIACVLIWRQDKPSQHKLSQKKSNLLERSKIQCHVVGDDLALRNFLCEDQMPVTCGGRQSHDQLEWVEFHKELEPLLWQCTECGRRLVEAMSQLRLSEGQTQSTRRQLHHQHRALARALNEPELQRLRRDGEDTLRRLGERAQWLPASEHVRLAMERARRMFAEVDRASRRLEELSDGRRERLRDLARVRALQDETEQVLSWLRKKGDETLGKHMQLATSLSAIKQQEQDFEKFYFISMRHLDKGSDLVEAASQCPGEARSDGSRGSLKDLARSLKQHLRGFGERLEDTRERLEDTSRCFYLLDKAYEWALEAMKYMSRVGAVDEVQTPEQALQMLKLIQQYLMAHPAVSEEHFAEMLQLSAKVGNEKLQAQAKVAHARCQETMESIRTQQARLVQLRKMFGGEEEGCQRPASPKGWKAATSTPVASDVGRRRSVGSVPFIFKCNHHAAGHSCSCWDPSPVPDECCCSASTASTASTAVRNNLGNIQEVRESAEDLLDACIEQESKADDVCSRCNKSAAATGGEGHISAAAKRQLRRSCTWQYPTENFDEEDASRLSGLSGSGDEQKCEYSTDNSGDNTTEGSDGCAKSGENGDDPYEQEICNKSVPPVSVNSHLHCNASNLDLSNSLAEPGSKEQKTHKTLLYIMREMIQTERDYVNSLEYIIENYIPELLREDIPQALRGQRNVIFGNVEKIYEFHSQYFLRELEKCENSPLLIGQSFLTHEKKFYLYALYNKNKPKSDGIMSEYGSTFFKTKQLELGDKMDLASYLLKPVQRMGKYALLLQQLVKASADKSTDLDVTDMRAADKMVRFQLRHGNDLLAMDSLRDCDINVKEQGRLLRQNEFLVWQGKGKKCLRHVFLFEDLILFSKARRFPDRKNLDLYIYKNSIKMTDIGLTAKIGDSPTKFEIWFRKRKPNDTFTLQSMSEEIKQSWTEELSKLLWQQALRNRESRLAEMSSMGIGNKPCLDIRPSADQISDRSISIAQLSKTAPRFRNSISVSSGELNRSNKRPHSIISVSSSSSSGGSSSGASHTSNYGALVNLGFDPADSPRLHHRSATLNSQCSMESGIIADISLGSEDTDSSGTHWGVERSNSSATTGSANSAVSPTSPLSPLTETKPIVVNADQNDFFNIKL